MDERMTHWPDQGGQDEAHYGATQQPPSPLDSGQKPLAIEVEQVCEEYPEKEGVET